MARTVGDSRLDSRAARDRLPVGKVHWKTITPKLLHLGYRRKRKNEAGTWTVRHYLGLDAGGVGRYSTSTLGAADDYADADGQSILSYAEAQRVALAMNPAARRSGSITVGDVMADYVAWLYIHKTIARQVERRVQMYIQPIFGHVRVADLTTDDLNKWRDSIALSPAPVRTATGAPRNSRELRTKDQKRARKVTANNILQVLKTALNRAFDAGLVDDDKAWRRVKPFGKVTAARARFLTVEEAQRLINAADPASGFRDMVHAALITGCRYGELCRLRVEDFHNGKVAVRESKSGKPRWVRLNEEGRAFFEKNTLGRAGSEVLLPRHRATGLDKPWGFNQQLAFMAKACERARLDPPITFHGLRHTWASLAIMAGVPLMVVADNMGHVNTKMVEQHYGHLAQTYMDDAIMAGAPRFGAVEKTNVSALRK
jgi:integrase